MVDERDEVEREADDKEEVEDGASQDPRPDEPVIDPPEDES